MISKKKNRRYDHRKIEPKWQKKWLEEGLNYPSKISAAKNSFLEQSSHLEQSSQKGRKPFYNLWMYPYPSAEGLHAGHAFSSTGSDVYGRFMRMNGKNVFQPIGYDSFGIHSENYALNIGEHPQDMLSRTIKNYERQLASLGHGYDWTRTVTTSEIDYYQWTQWLFVQMFKAGLAYRKKASVNWCPSCKTVLADEQVIAGECERCGKKVKMRDLEQWFFRITDYADRLLENLKKIDWPEKIKIAQRNWIGRSEGAEIKFQVPGSRFQIKTFTTRPDTLYGATFFVISPEHPDVDRITVSKYRNVVQKYRNRAKKKSREERISERAQKSGVFSGGYVINPATKEKIPVYVADYVLMDYGTGAVMGVPAHDARDWDFAKKHKAPIIEVISGGEVDKSAYDGPGKLVNSDKWNGLEVPKEMGKVIKDLEKHGWGKDDTSYHIRDWLISRQRYWGPPIPMIFCRRCKSEGRSWIEKNNNRLLRKDQSDWEHPGWYPEEKLPVELPYYKDYKPKGGGRGPLSDHPEFYKTKCPRCQYPSARRETDVSDTFLDSSWYFLRYPSVGAKNASRLPFDPKITKRWLPVDLYFGGAEHAVLHLMYSRFVTMVLSDLKHLDFDEPFPRFFAHGLMIKDGAKMSKSRGNVVNPDEYIEKFGADTLRLYLMFMGPMDGYPDFRDTGIEGMRRFIDRVWDLFENYSETGPDSEENCQEITVKMHQTIKKTTEDVEKFHYNTAISAIMEFVNLLRDKTQESRLKTKSRCQEWDRALKVLAQLLAPFAPHLAEEAWQRLGVPQGEKNGDTFKSIHKSSWPEFDPELVKEDTAIIILQVNGKLRSTAVVPISEAKKKEHVVKLAKADEKIKKWLKGRKVKKTVFVPGKLLNFVLDYKLP